MLFETAHTILMIFFFFEMKEYIVEPVLSSFLIIIS